MILRELFYFDNLTADAVDDKRYEEDSDESIVQKKDTRKTRLKLNQINRLRKASELHTEKKQEDLHLIRQMYGIAAQAAGEAGGL